MKKNTTIQGVSIPSAFKPFLWSYDINKMDLGRDKKRIITNVLNLGTVEATNKLFAVYGKEDIEDAVVNPLPGEWKKKSLNFWSLIFGIEPKSPKRRMK